MHFTLPISSLQKCTYLSLFTKNQMKNKLYSYLEINIKTRSQLYWMQIYLSFSSQGTFK